MKRFLLILLCLVLCLGIFAGCKDKTGDPADTGEDTSDVTIEDTSEPDAKDTEEISEPDPSEEASASLVSLRQAMIETPQLFAAAYIGLTDTMDPVDTVVWIKEKAPRLCEDLPFITAVSDDKTIGESYGECYVIVPADSEATVAVNLIDFEGNGGEVLYRSESGEPVILFCNKGAFAPDAEVHITDSEGRNIVWYPQLDDEGYLYEAYDLDGNLAVMDFTSYDERLKSEYDYYLNEAGFWKVPEKVDLADTSWQATDYMMDGTECTYSLDIFADTVNIAWNDGIDEETHYYTAPWTLKNVDGVAMMEIDLGNLDGVRCFPVLMTTEHNLIWFAQDFVNDAISDYQKLSRTLERTLG